MNKLLEIACDSVPSAINAQSAGADRIELCENLNEGGVTPSAAKLVLSKQQLRIPIFVLIRPRAGDFHYRPLEVATMLASIRLAKEQGADGVVSGALQANGTIDVTTTEKLIKAAAPLPFTFHRAFDRCVAPTKALETLIELGVQTILTSGQATTALEGKGLIQELVQQADGRIELMAGGGIRPNNIAELAAIKGLNAFHSSARTPIKSQMEHHHFLDLNEADWQGVSVPMVRFMRQKLSI